MKIVSIENEGPYLRLKYDDGSVSVVEKHALTEKRAFKPVWILWACLVLSVLFAMVIR